MHSTCQNTGGQTLLFAVALVLTTLCLSQEAPPSQVAGVDNTKMGAYRALAQLSFQAFEKGDATTAAELARVLERTWDKGEEQGGAESVAKLNPALFKQIDDAM